jgi:hypothetical protein
MRPANNSDNNNTFTWSGPSGVLGCTGQRPVGPRNHPSTRSSCDGCHAVPLNLLFWWTTRESPRRKRITTQVWRRSTNRHTRTPLTLNRSPLVCFQLRTLRWVLGNERSQLAMKRDSLLLATLLAIANSEKPPHSAPRRGQTK